MTIINRIAHQLVITTNQVEAVLKLHSEGSTIPFIARYRKEATNELDEVFIEKIIQTHAQLTELEDRRAFILEKIASLEKLTPELETAIRKADTLAILEDLYMPYKPKRQTRGQKAREKGLEPLANQILSQTSGDIHTWAEQFITEEVPTIEEALQGAADIIAETINESADVRKSLRDYFQKEAILSVRVLKDKETEAEKFKDYFEFSEPLHKMPSHRYLAIRRGVEEGFLKLDIEPEQEESLFRIEKAILTNKQSESAKFIKSVIPDAYKRLLQPSLETEFKQSKKEEADTQAIDVFSENLKQLLLASPLGQKRLLALDPGFRTGCKVVVISETGEFVTDTVIYPHEPQKQTAQAANSIENLIAKYDIEAIAIGNGTASRETESFVRGLMIPSRIAIAVVSESGASIYSASEVAREEFPELDVTVRGAISIGRRMLDPLAELVKIDPKSIGVGQYQHDVDQPKLKQALDRVVESSVNLVGVNINTASKHLLAYVSGLGPSVAKQIVQYRASIGKFKSRKEIQKVPRLGAKAFEQCAGFLRIPGGDHPLDNSAVHPERYALVETMAKDLNCSPADLMQDASKLKLIDLKRYVSAEVGLPTLKDIVKELEKPGLDPRGDFQTFAFDDRVKTMNDLSEGMELNGIVTNITDFGAFVDIGVKQDGLVHISQMANKFISHPNEVVKLGQKVKVRVTVIEVSRKRIGLSMK